MATNAFEGISQADQSAAHEHSALRMPADGFLKLLRTKQLKRILYFSVIWEHSEKSPK